MKVTPYITFNGTCEEAVKLYQSILGGETSFLRYDSLPETEDMEVSEEWKDKIMHSSLTFEDGSSIYFSDTWEEYPVEQGNNSTIHLEVDSEQKVHDITGALSKDGTITMPPEKTFWGSVYGALEDKYGICWGVEFKIE